MEILSVSLTNFKSHSDRHFQFQPGTNAICGENGAGKTSILEAIAWTLFNYKGPYKIEDLIRNGANSAQARIVFISSRDGRTYEVSRCTSKGYSLYDPQLNQRLPYKHIEEEIMPWLRQHLGVAPGTDLGRLFANTIGVPQGTFTADFLQTPERRKPIFDAILKVEEYRQVHKDSRQLEKYAEDQVEELKQKIAEYQEALAQGEPLKAKHQELAQDIHQVQLDLQQWQQQSAQLQTEQAELSAQANQVQQLTARLDGLASKIQSQGQLVEQFQAELQQSEQAVAVCRANRESYQAFLQAEATLQTLEQQRHTQEQLLQQRQRQWDQLRDRQSQLSVLTHKLDRLTTAKTEIERLQPHIEQQAIIEQQQQAVSEQLQACHGWRQTIQREATRVTQLQTRQTQLSQEIEQIAALESIVQTIPDLEQQQQRYQEQLSRIAAALQFEADLQQIVTQAQTAGDRHTLEIQKATATLKELQQATPLWTTAVEQVLGTLETGANLQGHLLTNLQGILNDLAEQVSAPKLQQQLQQVQSQLQTVRQQQAQFLTLETKKTEEHNLVVQITDTQAAIAQLQNQLAGEPDLKQQQAELATALQSLGDPRGQSRLLQQELKAFPELERQQQTLQISITQIQQAIADLDEQLLPFANLSEQIQAQQQQREQQRPAYQIYLEHQQAANSFRARRTQVEQAIAQLEALEQEHTDIAQSRDQLAQTYDPEKFQAVQAAYQEAHTQQIRLQARLPEMQKRLDDLGQQLAELATIQEKCDRAQVDIKRREKIKRFISFARKAYKEAGPRITERYVQSISREADRIFRELLNRQNVSLEWTRDYEILVQEGPHTRRFINLAGGEQMCAALAVRLALLRVLADIDIAFFDEPTTNMDRTRRERLAEAIANIKTFRQLFVISHDDTFEKFTENIILVERESG